MSIVRKGRRMIRARCTSYLKRTGDAHHIPSSERRVAVSISTAHLRVGSFSAGKLRLRVVTAEPGLLHGFARIGFGVSFLMAGECFVIQPSQRVVERLNVIRRL